MTFSLTPLQTVYRDDVFTDTAANGFIEMTQYKKRNCISSPLNTTIPAFVFALFVFVQFCLMMMWGLMSSRCRADILGTSFFAC